MPVELNSRVQALRDKHAVLSAQLDEARKSRSVDDFYVSQIKKQKLLVKEKIRLVEEQEGKRSVQ